MARLTTKQRQRLTDGQFAYIDRDGERHLPIHDEEHVRNAVQRFGQADFESKDAKAKAARRIVKAAKAHGIEVAEGDDVAKAAR